MYQDDLSVLCIFNNKIVPITNTERPDKRSNIVVWSTVKASDAPLRDFLRLNLSTVRIISTEVHEKVCLRE